MTVSVPHHFSLYCMAVLSKSEASLSLHVKWNWWLNFLECLSPLPCFCKWTNFIRFTIQFKEQSETSTLPSSSTCNAFSFIFPLFLQLYSLISLLNHTPIDITPLGKDFNAQQVEKANLLFPVSIDMGFKNNQSSKCQFHSYRLLFVFCTLCISYHGSGDTYLSSWDWLILLNIMVSRCFNFFLKDKI